MPKHNKEEYEDSEGYEDDEADDYKEDIYIPDKRTSDGRYGRVVDDMSIDHYSEFVYYHNQLMFRKDNIKRINSWWGSGRR